MIVGNRDTWTGLLSSKPLTAVLSGPSGVGRWYGSSLFVDKFARGTVLRVPKLRVAEAERIIEFACRGTTTRCVLIDSKDSTKAAWNDLLSVLESPPKGCYLWIVDNGGIPKSIKTRCMHYFFNVLEPEDILKVISRVRSPEEALKVEGQGFHTVEEALWYLNNETSISWAQNLVNATNGGSFVDVVKAVKEWDEDSRICFEHRLGESLQRRSEVFSALDEDEVFAAFSQSLSGDDPRAASLASALTLLFGP